MTTPLAFFLPLVLALAPIPAVETLDATFHPKLSLVLAPVPQDLAPSSLRITEDGRTIRTLRVSAVDNRPDALRVTFLSAARHPGPHALVVSWPGGSAGADYASKGTRRLGPGRLRTLRLRVRGPDGAAVPCRLLARNDDTGSVVEDLTTPGGYGSLATGLGLEEGPWTVELRLLSLDLYLTTVAIEVAQDRTTDVNVELSGITLPASLPGPADAFHLEVTREGAPVPFLAVNLAALVLDGAPTPFTLPLPPGSYSVTLRRARSDAHPPALPWTTRVVLPSGRAVPLPLPW